MLLACLPAPSHEASEQTSPVGDVTSTLPPPPPSLHLDPFYRKYVDAEGIPVAASEKVPDEALRVARDLLPRMVPDDAEIWERMIQNRTRVAIMAESEVTIDIPEHSDLTPPDHWNRRARGLGATLVRPACSGAEENLLGYPGDRYDGESILIHEFAHTVLGMGITFADPGLVDELRKAYESAIARGLWKDTYAATNFDEYWAEGVQSWFDANRESAPANGVHNEVNTREELEAYDPALAGLVARVFGRDDWRFSYPSGGRSR